jgi:hypothetical protein
LWLFYSRLGAAIGQPLALVNRRYQIVPHIFEYFSLSQSSGILKTLLTSKLGRHYPGSSPRRFDYASGVIRIKENVLGESFEGLTLLFSLRYSRLIQNSMISSSLLRGMSCTDSCSQIPWKAANIIPILATVECSLHPNDPLLGCSKLHRY